MINFDFLYFTVKDRLNNSFAFAIFGILGTIIAFGLTIPLWPDLVYVAAGFTGLASGECVDEAIRKRVIMQKYSSNF